jgi:hypothetical protein
MRKGNEKTDRFPGILHSDGNKAKYKCTVALATRLTRGASANAVASSLTIDSAGQTLPDGMYRLDVRGRIFPVRREGGRWPILYL